MSSIPDGPLHIVCIFYFSHLLDLIYRVSSLWKNHGNLENEKKLFPDLKNSWDLKKKLPNPHEATTSRCEDIGPEPFRKNS